MVAIINSISDIISYVPLFLADVLDFVFSRNGYQVFGNSNRLYFPIMIFLIFIPFVIWVVTYFIKKIRGGFN